MSTHSLPYKKGILQSNHLTHIVSTAYPTAYCARDLSALHVLKCVVREQKNPVRSMTISCAAVVVLQICLTSHGKIFIALFVQRGQDPKPQGGQAA